MGEHRTPHGEKSTAQKNGKESTPGYEGHHKTGRLGITLGDPNRASKDKGGEHSRGD